MAIERLADASVLLQCVLLMTGWMAIAILAAVVMRRHAARAHAFLVAGMCGAVATTALALVSRLFDLGLFAPAPAAAPANQTTVLALEPNLVGSSDIGILTVLLVAWLALSLLMLAMLARSIWRSAQLVRRAEATSMLRSAAHRTASQLGLARTPDVRVSGDVRCPHVWCWGRTPILLVPRGADAKRIREWEGAFAHELAHWRRRDHLTSLAAELLVALLPWHPLAWIIRRRLAVLREEACDQWALACGAPPAVFAETLLALVPQRPAPAVLAMAPAAQQLARRIQRLFERETDPRAGVRTTVSALLFVVVAAPLGALAHARVPNPVESDAAPPVVVAPDAGQLVYVAPNALDLGVVSAGTAGVGTAWIVNTSDAPISLLKTQASCGCTTVRGGEPGIVAPGAMRKLDITMTAPETADTFKTKTVTFMFADGIPPIELPVRLHTARE